MNNITFNNITATGEHGIVIAGNADSIIENVTFDQVNLTIREGELQRSFGGNFDYRPARDQSLDVFAHDIPGLYASHVKNLAIRNFNLHWEGHFPDFFQDGLEIENFEGVVIDGFAGRQPQIADKPKGAAIKLRHGRKITIRNSEAKEGTQCFKSKKFGKLM